MQLAGSYFLFLFNTKVFTLVTKPQDLAGTLSVSEQRDELFPEGELLTEITMKET